MVQALRGQHLRLCQQDEVPDPLPRGPLDHGPQQRAPRPAGVLRYHGERPDLGLVRAGDHLARVRPRLAAG